MDPVMFDSVPIILSVMELDTITLPFFMDVILKPCPFLG